MKRRRAGITLLEIMISMSLLSIVLVAFATVFPSGYRLNYSNINQSKAAGIASNIIEQLSNQPVAVLHSYESTNALTNLTGANPPIVTLPANVATSQSTANTVNPYWIANLIIANSDASDDPAAVSEITDPNSILKQVFGEQVTVTVSWTESRRNSKPLTKSLSETTLITSAISK